jgi:MEMO1 family protein
VIRAGNPRLRAVEAFPVQHEGQRCIALRDPAGFTDRIAVLPGPLLDLVSLFDGEHPVAAIHEILRRRHGEAPSVDQIGALIEQLDDAGFLDSERFRARRRATDDAFRQSPTRPAAHAGGAYAGAPEALREQIAGFFRHPDGPGPADGARPADGPSRRAAGTLSALIAPHIDFHRGGPTYGRAYQEVLDRSDADLFVILGTCHAGMADPFAITLKPYDTPLGPAAVDRDFYEALARRAGQDLLASEPAHRAEHSIEFQALMLQYLLGARRPFTILPVLASYLHEAVWAGTEPEADPRVPRFLDALGETIASSPRRVCLIAGVDLAHVGPRFGDPDANTEASLATVERADRAMLEPVVAGDARGFFAGVAADGDARRICGLSPIYSLLRVLPEAPGRLIQYRQWPDPEGAVTFCAVSFP